MRSDNAFVINWKWQPGAVCYLTNSQRKPYTPKIEEAKTWKTRASAERFLKRKDPSWAASCEIVQIPETAKGVEVARTVPRV